MRKDSSGNVVPSTFSEYLILSNMRFGKDSAPSEFLKKRILKTSMTEKVLSPHDQFMDLLTKLSIGEK